MECEIFRIRLKRVILRNLEIINKWFFNLHDCKYDISDKTYIPLQETIDLCDQKLFEAKNNIDGLSQDSFREILTVIKTENFFILKQIKHFVCFKHTLTEKLCSFVYRCTCNIRNITHYVETYELFLIDLLNIWVFLILLKNG